MTVYPDVEKLLIDYLEPIVSVPAYTRIPHQRPEGEWLQIRRVGGVNDIVRDRPRLDVWAWAGDDAASHDLLMAARSAIHALKGTSTLGPACYQVEEFLGPTRSDDRETGSPRMWMTVQLSIRTS